MQEAGSRLVSHNGQLKRSYPDDGWQEFDSRVAVRRPVAAGAGDIRGAVLKDVAGRGGEALQVTVDVGDNGLRGVDEVRVLNKDISLHARVDAGSGVVLVAVVVDVAGTKAERGETGVDIGEVVVVVGDLELALVLAAVAVRVTDEGTLPLCTRVSTHSGRVVRMIRKQRTYVVMELGPGDGDRVTGMGDIKETIVVILATNNALAGQVTVVNPDPGSTVQGNEIAFADGDRHLQVAQDDVASIPDAETAICNTRAGANTEDRGVALNVHGAASTEVAVDADDTTSRDSGLEGRAGRDCGSGAAATTSDTSTVSDELVDRSRAARATTTAAGAGRSGVLRGCGRGTRALGGAESGRGSALPVARALLGDLLGLVTAVGGP